ncbi:MAG: NADH-quinone oxidoreductase subunit C [bacterium]|nr:NADH-quinone oxidoreductase subunit C [bacterium]MCP4798468.1 NADH-quinone oxidoreductase subunit C [bacterium]
MEALKIHELLKERFADAVGEFNDGLEKGSTIEAGSIAEVAEFMRNDETLSFDLLMCLTGVDWDGYDENGKGKSVAILGYDENGEPEQSDRVAEGDFGVLYSLYSYKHGHKFTLTVRVTRQEASVPTVGSVWPTANWHEREAYDLVGINFAGHPNLCRILLDDEWEGHPLRKDYVMPGTWLGVPMNGQPLATSPFSEDDVKLPGGES